MPFKTFCQGVVVLAAVLASCISGLAHAGTARIEWFPLGSSGALPGEQSLATTTRVGSAEVDTTNTSSAVSSSAAPSFTYGGIATTGVARVTAISGDLIVTASGTASQTNGVRIPLGATRFIPVNSGGTLSLLQDSNATSVNITPIAGSSFVVTPSSSPGAALPNGMARVNAAATTNATSLKSGSGRLFSGQLCNVAAYDVFFKAYNKTTAPTVGTDTPLFVLPIKAGTCIVVAQSAAFGLPFNTGIAYAITKLIADSDTTAVAAGDVQGYLTYG